MELKQLIIFSLLAANITFVSAHGSPAGTGGEKTTHPWYEVTSWNTEVLGWLGIGIGIILLAFSLYMYLTLPDPDPQKEENVDIKEETN